jgi:hypothetical protein
MTEAVCAIGFSGHRRLPNAELVAAKLAELLADLQAKARCRLIAVSSIAIGADIAFVEACLENGMPWIAILPMRSEEFFNENDFPDAQIRARAMALLERAACVEITKSNCDDGVKDARAARHDAFSDTGQRIVDYCDIFIAVLRPTAEPPKRGGTAEILGCAKRGKRPIAIVNPDDGSVEYHAWRASPAPPCLSTIESIPAAPLREEFLTADCSPELRIVVGWFSRFSAAARRNVPRLRSMTSTAVILHGCAVMLALAMITVPWIFGRGHHLERNLHLAEWLKVLIAGAAFTATMWFLFGRPHARAARYRLCAEICRSLLSTWDLPEVHRAIFRGFPPEWRSLIRMLLNVRRLAGPSLQELDSETSEESWRNFNTEYLTSRIRKQIDYYKREQGKARRRLRVLEPLSWICSTGGLLLVTYLAITATSLTGLPAFGTIAFPALAGVFISLLAVKETTRREARYGEMLEMLEENATNLEGATHQSAACEIVIDNERALLAENIEWANTAKHPAAG